MKTSYLASFLKFSLCILLLYGNACNPEEGGDRKSTKISQKTPAELTRLKRLTYAVYSTNLDSSIIYSKQALKIALDKNLPLQAAKWKTRIGAFYRIAGLHTVAENYYAENLKEWQMLDDSVWIAIVYEERGFNFLGAKNYSDALSNMRKALALWEVVDSTEKIIDTHLDLSSYFTARKITKMARKEFEYASQLLGNFSDNERDKRASMIKGNLLLLEKKYDQAIEMYLIQDNPDTYTNIGFIYKEWGDEIREKKPTIANKNFQESLKYHQKSFNYHQSQGAVSRLILDCWNLGGIHRRLKNYNKAIETLKKGISLARSNKEGERMANMYRTVSETYEDELKGELALENYKTFVWIKDSLKKDQEERITQLAEVHYDTERTEKEKIQVEQENQLREKQLWLSILFMVSIAGLCVFYYDRYQSKKKLMQQQSEINSRVVVDLIKENTINILDSKLEGQEQERERISRELHDNLGGTLAAVKLSLEGLEKEINPELQEKYIHTHKLLQQATQETRTLSHEMKALSLEHLGLDDSLKSLCETLNVSGKLEGHFSSINPNKAVIKQQSQLHLYRICQELIQNVIKHAHATEVFLQLTYENDKLVLMMEDDGQGFDVSKNKNGLGMDNIQNRVAQINGKLDFDSSIGNGTTVIIEVPTEPN